MMGNLREIQGLLLAVAVGFLATCKSAEKSQLESTSSTHTDHAVTKEGKEAEGHLNDLQNQLHVYNIGLLRIGLAGDGSSFDEFVPDSVVNQLLNDFKASAENGGKETPSGWRFSHCVKPEKGNWNITANSPIKDCSSVLTNPRILRREAEMSLTIAKVGDRFYPKVEIAYPDLAEPWAAFVGKEPISGMVVLRFRPNISYDKLIPIMSVTPGAFQPETRQAMKRTFDLRDEPSDLAKFSDLLVLKARRNEVTNALLSGFSAAAFVIGVGEVIEAGLAIQTLLSTGSALGARATATKLGGALFKLALGGTASLHETVRVLGLEDLFKKLPENSPLRGPLGMAIQVAHMSTYFAIADLAFVGRHIVVDAFRLLVEGKVLVALGKGLNPNHPATIRQAILDHMDDIQGVLLSTKVLSPRHLEEIGELFTQISSKVVSTIHATEGGSGHHDEHPAPVRDAFGIAQGCIASDGSNITLDVSRDHTLRMKIVGVHGVEVLGRCKAVAKPDGGDDRRFEVDIAHGQEKTALIINYNKKMIAAKSRIYQCSDQHPLQNQSALVEYCK